MGLIDRIKTWFRRKPKTSMVSHPSEIQSKLISEGDLLAKEHEELESERARLRQEIYNVDSRYSNGEIEAGDRDRAYRMRLARAGRISMRQLEIRSQLVKMGYPIPDEWGVISNN